MQQNRHFPALSFLPTDVADVPRRAGDPALFRYIDRTIRHSLPRAEHDPTALAVQAHDAVLRLLHEGGFGADLVARALGCSTRTLVCQLAGDGTSLRRIVDEVRKQRALTLLADGRSIKEAAALLGYSDPTSFQHAFRRWHGDSPKAWLKGRR